jgi:nicotinate-nucleotide--dimethylbenzimidazole phosphoribosyltransferase
MIPLPSIAPPSQEIADKLRAYIDGLAKPPGSLGRMEDIAVRLGAAQNVLKPVAQRALLLVFAGDHGLTNEGVSRYPAAVTLAMVETFLAGRATANAFARAVEADMKVVDAGIAKDLPARDGFIKASVRAGTRNAAVEPAMTAAELDTAMTRGVALARDAAAQGYDILAVGEMGIGNSASAALLMHRLAGFPLDQCVGRGAGHDDAGLANKLRILQRAADRTATTDPSAVLAEFGGYEIAMMAGAIIGAAAARRVVVVDGFISTSAALAAARLAPEALNYCFFSHRSAESGHSLMLQALNARPLLELEMRLGEGTGALLAIPLLRAAARLVSDVATLEEVLAGAGKNAP